MIWKNILLHHFILVGLLVLDKSPSKAADTPNLATPEVATPQPIPGTYQILEQRIVQHDGYTVTYNRITPPQISKVPAPVALPLTPEEQALVDSRRGKAHGNLSIGCTVFDHEVTELHWTSGGKRHVAYSNIDFNLVAERETGSLACSVTKRGTGSPACSVTERETGSPACSVAEPTG